MGKLLFEQTCVPTPFPHEAMLRNNKQKFRQVMFWVRNIV